MTDQMNPQQSGSSRRDFLRRGAIVGGSLVWAAPAVQSLARPAFASHGTCAQVRLYEYTRSGANWNPVTTTTTIPQPACVPSDWVGGQATGAGTDVTVARIENNNASARVTVNDPACAVLLGSDLKGMDGGATCQDGTWISQTQVDIAFAGINQIRFQLCCNP